MTRDDLLPGLRSRGFGTGSVQWPADPENTLAETGYDAIVVGSGAAGGIAALGLAEAGLRVLVLEAAWQPPVWRTPYRHAVSGLARSLARPEILTRVPPRLLHYGRRLLRAAGKVRQPIQTQCYAWERQPDAFVDDRDLPFTTPPGRPFTWLRARMPGGRVAIPGHGRQYFRLGPDDLDPPDGLTPRWPLAPGELEPWYRHVEALLRLSGNADGLACLPDSDIAFPLRPLAAESAMRQALRARWPHVRCVLGRHAPPFPGLTRALATGRATLRQGAVVRHVEVGTTGTVEAVAWIDAASGRQLLTRAPIVFLCASALESTRILLLSRTRSGAPIGTKSGQLGRNLMDHIMTNAEGMSGPLPDGPVALADGRCLYLPRFDGRAEAVLPPARGFGVQLYQTSGPAGSSYFNAIAFSEMLPRADNQVRLHPTRVDTWGIPILHISCAHSDAELRRAAGQTEALRDIAGVAGATLSIASARPAPPGCAAHECSTARMGDDPATSVLDGSNQCWDARGLFVTDAACFPSQGSQNPTLTVMALSARAAAHAAGASPGNTAFSARPGAFRCQYAGRPDGACLGKPDDPPPHDVSLRDARGAGAASAHAAPAGEPGRAGDFQ